MKLNKSLKIEGIFLGLCIVLILVGFAMYFTNQYTTSHGGLNLWFIFVYVTTSPLFIILIIADLIYWFWRVNKYQTKG